ncbi:protein FAM227B-like [Corticium candelabrum]|uniref:protein FAM227B-like n=1 Tax=Corticium candelabrum TaxID=121492 RepID=UPI002E256C30|nr:protein FAM227B-like [Corticium candelabrum]
MDELTPLPSQLEALQILLKVTQAQGFKPGFTKLWKKVFLSQSSVAILQDAFWWLYLDHFQPNDIEAKSQLFARIGDSYVALFCYISLDFKDKFFRFYADCLSQAIFTTFCQAYPALRMIFHDEKFKTHLVNVVWEWIAGIRPPAGSWSQWKMYELDPDYIVSAPIETDESFTHAHKRASKILFNLGDMEASLPVGQRSVSRSAHIDRRGSIKPRRSSLSPIKFQSRNISPLSNKPLEEESEQIGRGPEFERVLFDTKGHSPLVSHYLQSRHLLTEGPGPTDYMKRTQLSALPPPAPTYRDVIHHAHKVGKKMAAEYEREQHEFMMEEQRARKQNRKLRQEFQRLTNEILSRQHEVKMLSDRLIDSLASGSYMPIGTLLASVLNPLDVSEFSESESNMSVSSDHQDTRKSVTPENRPSSSRSVASRQTPQ